MCYDAKVRATRTFFAAVGFGAWLTCVPVAAPASQTVLDQTIAAGGARVLQLSTGGADVVLSPSDDASSVRVTAEQNGPAPAPHLENSRAANRVVVSIAAPGHSLVPFAAAASMTYTIAYPARMRVDLRATSGNVQIVRPQAAVDVFDQEGDVTVDAPRAAITIETAHGDVNVTHAQTSIDLAADAGAITADLLPGWTGGEVRLQTQAGDIHLAVPRALRAHVYPSSGSGSIHNDFGRSTAPSPLVWLYSVSGNLWLTVLP